MTLHTDKRAKILVVEDELIVAQNIENQLRKLGYDVPGTAHTGLQAIALAHQFKPDLVLMDIKLSGPMDGIDTANKIRSQLYIPVVYLTAYADNETLNRAKITDPFGYLLKPFELRNLHSTIEIALYRHQLENKLKVSEMRFRTLAESAPVGIFQFDSQGRCIYVNHLWSRITGISSQDAMGDGWISTIHPEDRDPVLQSFKNLVQTNTYIESEFRLQAPDGNVSWVFCRAAVMKHTLETSLSSPTENEPETTPRVEPEIDPTVNLGYIGTITDITIRKKLEEEILMAKKLESIGILAGGLAHDFNNLLAVIVGNISIMKEDPGISRDNYQMLERAEKASNQASTLAQKLITFSEGGWLIRKRLQLPLLISEIIDQDFFNFRSAFAFNFPKDLLPIHGDRSQLKQVFMNIIQNAVESCNLFSPISIPDRVRISIEASNADFTEHPIKESLKPGHYLKIKVIDTGEGISSENLGKIFDPYFTTKEKSSQKGLGLGMTICYSIIRKHEGFIDVNSQKNIGTTVEIYLPAFIEEATVPAPQPTASILAEKKRILVMDDESVVLDVTRKMLERLGYQVEVFEEGQQAIDAYVKGNETGNPFHLLMLDLVNKKGLGGKDTLNFLLNLNPRVKVVALSGYSDLTEIDRLKSSGFIDVLSKPYKLGDLKRVLDEYCPIENSPQI